MSKEQRNSTTPSDEPTALTQRESGEVPVLLSIDERISQADDFQEIVFLTYVRKEIIQQDEEAKNQEHQRFLEKAQVWYKMGFSVIAFVVGIGLLIGGLAYPGLLISGAGLFGVAPDYVKAILRIFRRDKGGENEEE
jgi:hypothetical protein